jgi:glycosyltransferase involved in cell wall biosynthesis
MISVVITSCGRLDLLRKTITSFLKYNTYPITEWIIVDDSCNVDMWDELKRYLPNCTLLLSNEKRGQIRCIDDAYSAVKTPYIFHCEDDYEFSKGGFMEQSLEILETQPTIMQVWLFQGHNHPVEPMILKTGDTFFRLLGDYDEGKWHGFTWNPGLRRLADYKLIAPFSSFIREGDFNALTECRIGQKFYEMGFRSAILNDIYCKHIGVGRHVDITD